MSEVRGFRIPRKTKVNAEQAAALATAAAHTQAVGVTAQIRVAAAWALRLSVVAVGMAGLALWFSVQP